MQRKHFDTIKARMEEPRRLMQVITGPRQVGKTTIVKQVLHALSIPSLYITTDGADRNDREWFARNWSSVRTRVLQEKYSEFILAIDEVHNIHDWSKLVKTEYDYDTYHDIPIKVLLTGSSRVMLMRGMSESLMGRFEIIPMSYWSYAEMKEAFGITLQEYIYFGGYPGATPFIKNEKRWRRYVRDAIVEATIEKDVLVDKPIQNPSLLRKTLELSSAYSGQELSLQKLVGELQECGSVSTAKNYMQLLKDSCLVAPLQKYANEPIRRKSSVPKMQVYNNALKTYNLDENFSQAMQDPILWGRLYESCVGAHLLNVAFENDLELYYWRENNNEVDYVLKAGNKIVPIEVKSNQVHYAKGLTVFENKFHPIRSWLVGEGSACSIEQLLTMPIEYLWI